MKREHERVAESETEKEVEWENLREMRNLRNKRGIIFVKEIEREGKKEKKRCERFRGEKRKIEERMWKSGRESAIRGIEI